MAIWRDLVRFGVGPTRQRHCRVPLFRGVRRLRCPHRWRAACASRSVAVPPAANATQGPRPTAQGVRAADNHEVRTTVRPRAPPLLSEATLRTRATAAGQALVLTRDSGKLPAAARVAGKEPETVGGARPVGPLAYAARSRRFWCPGYRQRGPHLRVKRAPSRGGSATAALHRTRRPPGPPRTRGPPGYPPSSGNPALLAPEGRLVIPPPAVTRPSSHQRAA